MASRSRTSACRTCASRIICRSICDFTSRADCLHAALGRLRRVASSPAGPTHMNTDAPPGSWNAMPTASPGSRSTSPAASANVLSRHVLVELGDASSSGSRRSYAARVVVRSGKPSGFIAGADIKEFTGLTQRDRGLRADPHRPAGARPARGAAMPDGRGDQRLCAGWRTRARPRLPLPRRRGGRAPVPRDCPRCSSAFILDSAAPCARCG